MSGILVVCKNKTCYWNAQIHFWDKPFCCKGKVLINEPYMESSCACDSFITKKEANLRIEMLFRGRGKGVRL